MVSSRSSPRAFPVRQETGQPMTVSAATNSPPTGASEPGRSSLVPAYPAGKHDTHMPHANVKCQMPLVPMYPCPSLPRLDLTRRIILQRGEMQIYPHRVPRSINLSAGRSPNVSRDPTFRRHLASCHLRLRQAVSSLAMSNPAAPVPQVTTSQAPTTGHHARAELHVFLGRGQPAVSWREKSIA